MAENKTSFSIPNGTKINARYEVVEELGRGGAGVVFKVMQHGLDVPRALKVLDPIRDDRQEMFEETFKNEIINLSQLTHSNIVKIVDSDYFTPDQEDEPRAYFVMEYASGRELENAIEDKLFQTRDELLSMLTDLLDALVYFHSRGIVHGDIKPSNIVFSRGKHVPGNIEVKFADLGVSKLIPIVENKSPTNLTPDETYVWGTKNYAAPEVYDYVNTAQAVPSNVIDQKLDLYSFGVTIAELLSDSDLNGRANTESIKNLLSNIRDDIKSLFTPSEYDYFLKFILMLTAYSPEDRYQNSEQARSALLRITPKHMAFSSIPELTSVGCPHAIFQGDQLIKFSERVYLWLNHAVFQRLHQMNQLGFLFYVYSGARHSRFEHSLDTFELARELVLNLLNDTNFRVLMTEEDISLLLASSLLHDIGHYPLAHLIEDLQSSNYPRDPMDLSVVKPDYAMIHYFLKASFDSASEPLWDVLKREKIEPERLLKVVSDQRPETDAESLMSTLLDGAFDLDKISYLRQDSKSTSVPYGYGIDYSGLFMSLKVLLPSEYPQQLQRAELGVQTRGISAVESILTARYHLYDRVYWHRTNRSIMAMLSYAVSRLMGGSNPIVTFERYINETINKNDWEAVRWLSNEMDQAIENNNVQSVSGFPIRNPITNIVDGARHIYRRLVTFTWTPDPSKINQIHQYFTNPRTNDVEDIRVKILNLVKERYNIIDFGDEEILLDIPKKNHKTNPDIWVYNEYTKTISSFETYSEISKAVGTQYERIANRCRVFVSPRIANLAENDVVLKESIVELIYDMIR